MRTTFRTRRSIALFLLATISLTQGCHSFQRHSGAVPVGSRTRIESATPFLISPTAGASSVACSATKAEGVVNDATTESITFGSFRRVEWTDKACSSVAAGTVTLGANDEVRVHRFSATRSLALLGVVAGIIALSVSQQEYFGPPTGCGIVC